jgi:hypothetical protein
MMLPQEDSSYTLEPTLQDRSEPLKGVTGPVFMMEIRERAWEKERQQLVVDKSLVDCLKK